ncbi:MAG: hypothetical protein WCQ21_02035 [Verrucomicrobiota bacterium]
MQLVSHNNPTSPLMRLTPYFKTSPATKFAWILLILLVFLVLVPDALATTTNDGSATAKTVMGNWLKVAAWAMILGAGLCFIFAAYQAFQREWSSAIVSLLVCVLLGFGPVVLQWVAGQWGVNGSGNAALFIK